MDGSTDWKMRTCAVCKSFAPLEMGQIGLASKSTRGDSSSVLVLRAVSTPAEVVRGEKTSRLRRASSLRRCSVSTYQTTSSINDSMGLWSCPGLVDSRTLGHDR